MDILLDAFASCLPQLILSVTVLLLTWKSRGRIESIEASTKGFKIQFSKNGRHR